MKNLKISLQLIMLIGGLMVAFAAATYFEVRSSTATIYQQRYELLRTQVESALSVLKDFNDRAVAGEFTVEEAKTRAYDMLNKMRFEPDGYFFGYDYDVVMVFHPTSKDVGKSNKGKPDANGFAYRDELVRLGQLGGGFVEFIGPKPGKDPEDRSYPKASYGKVFEPWKVVIVTGLYTDDLKAEIRSSVIKTISWSIGIFALALIAAFFVIRNITKPLKAIHDSLEAVADENVDIAIPHTDLRNEIGMMAKATKSLQDKVRERHAMQRRQEEQQNQLDTERQNNLDMQRDEAALQARVVTTIGEAL